MTVKLQIRRPFFLRSCKPPAKPVPQPPSFRATISTCMEEWKIQQSARSAATPSAPQPAFAPRQPTSTPLSRVWSWLHARYKLTSTKRLRLAETLSLGEKRFVALVSVEGREFLIGGGASGVSMLAQLSNGPESGKAFATKLERASA